MGTITSGKTPFRVKASGNTTEATTYTNSKTISGLAVMNGETEGTQAAASTIAFNGHVVRGMSQDDKDILNYYKSTLYSLTITPTLSSSSSSPTYLDINASSVIGSTAPTTQNKDYIFKLEFTKDKSALNINIGTIVATNTVSNNYVTLSTQAVAFDSTKGNTLRVTTPSNTGYTHNGTLGDYQIQFNESHINSGAVQNRYLRVRTLFPSYCFTSTKTGANPSTAGVKTLTSAYVSSQWTPTKISNNPVTDAYVYVFVPFAATTCSMVGSMSVENPCTKMGTETYNGITYTVFRSDAIQSMGELTLTVK